MLAHTKQKHSVHLILDFCNCVFVCLIMWKYRPNFITFFIVKHFNGDKIVSCGGSDMTIMLMF